MSDQSLRALLVEPFPGRRWLSISRYANEIAGNGATACTEFDRVRAPWWNPPSIAEGLRRRWTAQAPVTDMHDVVHLTDHALRHHVSRFSGSPVVVTCHDLMPFVLPGYYRSSFEGRVKRFFMRKALDGMLKADHVICISERTARDVATHFNIDRRRLSVVPNMVDETFAPMPDARTWLAVRGVRLPERPLILSVGHGGPYKNLDTLLGALALPELQGAVLVRAGGRFKGARSRFAAQLGVADRVVELGGVSDAVLRNLYGACDVLAQPSLYEGFGVPVIEAMASGLPLVCSDGGALPDVAGNGGLIVPCAFEGPEAARVLATALGKVIADPSLRAELRARGLERAKAFHPERVMPLLREAYDQAIASSGSSRS